MKLLLSLYELEWYLQMDIDIDDLETIAHKLFQHAKDLGISFVHLPVDYYWSLPDSRMYDINAQPTELVEMLGMGQLTYDWNELINVLSNENYPSSSHYAWLAAIIHAVGEHLYDIKPELEC